MIPFCVYVGAFDFGGAGTPTFRVMVVLGGGHV